MGQLRYGQYGESHFLTRERERELAVVWRNYRWLDSDCTHEWSQIGVSRAPEHVRRGKSLNNNYRRASALSNYRAIPLLARVHRRHMSCWLSAPSVHTPRHITHSFTCAHRRHVTWRCHVTCFPRAVYISNQRCTSAARWPTSGPPCGVVLSRVLASEAAVADALDARRVSMMSTYETLVWHVTRRNWFKSALSEVTVIQSM